MEMPEDDDGVEMKRAANRIISILYLGGDQGWVRKGELANSLGDAVPKPAERPDSKLMHVNNGIIGDARRSTAELGKRLFDMKVDYAVKQIRELLN
jgi:creatinine amidohydrolase/Fe(II)-dependent formamide hydrolase-like protein